ncbi:MAG: hypothetical protein CMA27_06445 [Euryarchaeota archaeon]|nr:hypothetical protein [Euryarchaeota archaeon]|tara:strand:- start:1122 stop:2003 length:882 start_codon:yes stop_codon:yes gene_type:complete
MKIEIPAEGRVGSLITDSVRESFSHFSSQISESENLIIITRLSPRRLIRHIQLENVDFRWLTVQESEHSIDPSLEHVNHLVNTSIMTGNGTIWIDGLEYLADRQGFDAVHSFVRNVVDSVGSTKWAIILSIENGTFNDTQLAQITREAARIKRTKSSEVNEQYDPNGSNNEDESKEIKNNDTQIKTTGLKLLTKISKEGFTQKTLRERILQWRNMDLDVSILEPALNYQNPDDAYKLYSEVEELVRTAVELDARLDILKTKGENAKAFAYRYRIRQLTGLDEIGRIVDTLLSE